MKNFLNNPKVLIIGGVCLVAVVGLILGICLLCGGGSEPTEPSAQTAAYTLTVQTEGGQPMENVGVFVYADPQKQDLVTFERTDAQGTVAWNGAADQEYTVILDGVTAGYKAEETYTVTKPDTVLTLSATLASPGENAVISLGDVMYEISVTDTDGNEWSLSALLEEKDAVVLNFWYTNCAPCKAEFPYLQAAYEKYSDSIAVLALNPVDTEINAVVELRESMGLTFPMALCDKKWQDIFQITGYPTTVVVDRFGTASLIHMGSIPSADAFEELFAYYAADDYVQTAVSNLEDIVSLSGGEGTEEKPLAFSGTTKQFEIPVEPGKTVYCELTNVVDMMLTLKGDGIFAIYNGKTYESINGEVCVPLFAQTAAEVATVQVGSSASEAQTLQAALELRGGTESLPLPLNMGAFDTTVPAGDTKGVFYTGDADEDGTVTVTCGKAPAGVSYTYTLTNVTSGVSATLSGGSVRVEVKQGDQLKLVISAVNSTADAVFSSEAAFTPAEKQEQTGGSTGGNTGSNTGGTTGGNTGTTVTYNTTPTGDPIETGGMTSLEITVAPGELAYYHIYRLEGMYVTVSHSDAYIVLNGELYAPQSGGFSVYVNPGDVPNNYVPTKICFGNGGTQTITYTVTFNFPKGDYGNPYDLTLDKQFTTTQTSLTANGVYYRYTAAKDGVLTVKCLSVSGSAKYNYILYNLNSYQQVQSYNADTETSGNTVSIEVKAGQTVQLTIQTMVENSSDSFPTVTFTSIATLE